MYNILGSLHDCDHKTARMSNSIYTVLMRMVSVYGANMYSCRRANKRCEMKPAYVRLFPLYTVFYAVYRIYRCMHVHIWTNEGAHFAAVISPGTTKAPCYGRMREKEHCTLAHVSADADDDNDDTLYINYNKMPRQIDREQTRQEKLMMPQQHEPFACLLGGQHAQCTDTNATITTTTLRDLVDDGCGAAYTSYIYMWIGCRCLCAFWSASGLTHHMSGAR